MPDPWAGPGVRGDWLVDLGLEQPRTIDDWYKMLVLFRDNKGAQVPLIMSKSGQPGNSEFVGAFGIGSGYYRVNNVVKYGPIENGYKEYLTLMNKWYSEGLLDPDFAATNSDTNFYAEYITTGKAGAIVETYQDIVPLYNSLFSNKANYMTAVPYPVLRAGDTGHFGVINNLVDRTGNDFLTTRVSEDRVERICNWRDSWYTPESTMLFNYGIEGRSYNMVNGKPVFTNLLENNPDGLGYAVASWKYKLFCHSYIYDCFAKPEREVEASWASISTWKIQNDMANQMPPSMIRAEDSSDYSRIMTEVNTYKNQMVLKFIMGEEPLSNFDAYVRQLKTIGIERAIQYQQTALDLYNSH
jgi:putative aldouronate transport system substrate-binding protein